MRPIRLHVQQHQPRDSPEFQSAGPSLFHPNPSAQSRDREGGHRLQIPGQIIVIDALQDHDGSDLSDAGDMEIQSALPLPELEVPSRPEVRISNVERAHVEENPFWRKELTCPLSLAFLHDAVEAADRHVYSRSFVQEYFDRYGAFSPKSNIPLTNQTARSNVELRRRSSLQAKVEAERSKRSTTVCIQPENILLKKCVKEDHPLALEDSLAQTLASATDRARAQSRMGTGRNRVLLKGMWNGIRVVVAHDARNCGRARTMYDYVGLHPHILTCHGYLDNGDVVLEFAPLGSLAQVLSSMQSQMQHKKLTWSVQRDSSRQICSAMAHLAELGVVHRFLMLRSVMVTHLLLTTSTASIQTKLGDLETCSTSPNFDAILQPVTPVRWAAPEALKDPPEYSELSDVWSFGVVLWELLDMGRTIPYLQCWEDATVKVGVTGGQVQLLSPEDADSVLWEIAQECVAPQKEDRPSFFDLTLEIQWRCHGGSSTAQRRRPRAQASLPLNNQAPEHCRHHPSPFESDSASAEVMRSVYAYDNGDESGFAGVAVSAPVNYRPAQQMGLVAIPGLLDSESAEAENHNESMQPMLSFGLACALIAMTVAPLLVLIGVLSTVIGNDQAEQCRKQSTLTEFAAMLAAGGIGALGVTGLSLDAWKNRQIPASETSRCLHIFRFRNWHSIGIFIFVCLVAACFVGAVVALSILDCLSNLGEGD